MAVDPLTIAAVAAPLAGSLMGADAAGKSRKQAERLAKEAYSLLAGLEQPAFQDELYQYSPEMYTQLVGELKPALESAVELGPSAMADVMSKIDPRLQQHQMTALAKLSGISETGLSEEQKLALDEAKRGARSEAQSQKETVLMSAQQRGLADSGFARMAEMQAGQKAADRLSQEGMKQAAISAAEKTKAIEAAGALAGQIGQQRFTEQSAMAQAKDLRDQFTARNLQDVRMRNISQMNQAQAANLAAKQRIAEERAALNRRAMEQKSDLYGKRYDREYQKRLAQANALTGQQQQLYTQAGQQAQFGAGTGAQVGSIFADIYAANKKKPGQTEE